MRAALLLAVLALAPFATAALPLGPVEAGDPTGWSRDPLVRVVPYRLGLDFPVAIQMLDDGRIFYGEWQTGRVNIIQKDGTITNFVDLNVVTGGEMGLHEVSYHRDGLRNYVYVSYVTGSGCAWGQFACRNILSRFAEVAPGVAGPEERLRIGQGGIVHNGGIIAWGPQDGMMYLSRGDTGDAWLSQRTTGDEGRILRLNPNGSVPLDNPFGPGNPAWAYGLRHTFGLDFYPFSQRLVGTENGPERNDEINLLERGKNYGWPVVTGFEGNDPNLTDPLRAFGVTLGITNGHIYRGTKIPHWLGTYFWGDTNNGFIGKLVEMRDQNPQPTTQEVVVDTPFLVIDITTGPDGYFYFTRPEGIYKVVPVNDDGSPGIRLPQSLGDVLVLLPSLPELPGPLAGP